MQGKVLGRRKISWLRNLTTRFNKYKPNLFRATGNKVKVVQMTAKIRTVMENTITHPTPIGQVLRAELVSLYSSFWILQLYKQYKSSNKPYKWSYIIDFGYSSWWKPFVLQRTAAYSPRYNRKYVR